MQKLRAAVATLIPRFERKEWEAIFIASLAVALWFFQRYIKAPRWTGAWMVRSVFLYALMPFAVHALFALEGLRRRYAGLVFVGLAIGVGSVRFALAPSDPINWAILGAGVLFSLPLFRFCDVRDLGVRLGEARLWVPVVALGWAVTLAGILAMAHTPSFLKSYPYVPLREGHLGLFALREAAEVVDMFDWEFLFRGFLLFTLTPRIGAVAAILVQATLFGCSHVGKPELEIYASILGGLALGHLCLRVRSMLPAFVAHQAIFLTAEIAAVMVKLRA